MQFTIRDILQEKWKAPISSFKMVVCWKWLLSQYVNFDHRDNTGQPLPPLYSSNFTTIFQYQLVHCPCQLIFVFHRKCKGTYHHGLGTPSNHMKLFTPMHRIEVALNKTRGLGHDLPNLKPCYCLMSDLLCTFYKTRPCTTMIVSSRGGSGRMMWSR